MILDPEYSGNELSVLAKKHRRHSRIVALVDVFDALGTRRVYKEPWPQEKILEYIRGEAGKKFDPKLVELFFAHIDEIRTVIEQYRDP